MTTATYHISVDAFSEQDAIDIAARTAKGDGWIPTERPEHATPVGVHRPETRNRWAVKLAVKKAA